MYTETQNPESLNKINQDLKDALLCFADSVSELGPLAAKVTQIKKALKANDASLSFRVLVEQYAKLQQNLNDVAKRDSERDYQTLKHQLNDSAAKNLAANQAEKINKVLAEIKFNQPSHAVMVSLGKALNYFAAELAEIRADSPALEGDAETKAPASNVVAMDVFLASKRLLKDVVGTANRLLTYYPTDKIINDLLNEASQEYRSSELFFKSVDLLARISDYLEVLLQRQHCAALESLHDIHSNIVSIVKYSSLVSKLVHSSKGSSDRVTVEMLEELQRLEQQAKSIDSVDHMKNHINDSVTLMSDMIHDFVKTQTKLYKSNLKTIKHLNRRVNKATHFIERLEQQLDRAIDTNFVDDLTGVGNRRGYVHVIDQERKTWLTTQRSLSLMVIDVDKFKQVNDTYGHRVGDQVLKFLSQTLKDNIRTSDYLARYGGEEFVIVLPQTDIDKALKLAEKVRKVINSLRFEVRNNATALKVTCSFGISMFTDETSNTIDVFEAADNALYKAKHNGRNDIVALVDGNYIHLKK